MVQRLERKQVDRFTWEIFIGSFTETKLQPTNMLILWNLHVCQQVITNTLIRKFNMNAYAIISQRKWICKSAEKDSLVNCRPYLLI